MSNTTIVASDGESGLTLVELLIVLVVLGLLIAIAVPGYLGFRERAMDSVARANVRAAVPAVHVCFEDTATYVGCDAATLLAVYDGGLKTAGQHRIVISDLTSSSYCIAAEGRPSRYWSKAGPGAPIEPAAC